MRARVESLSYGAHGVARVDGKVYFVRNAAPGDEVELSVREDHGTYAFADSVVVEPGPVRRVPPCEYLPRCGGCPWQQVEYAAQLEAKQRAVVDLLRRLGGFDDPPVSPILASPGELGYRRRLSLRVEGGRVGYFAAASHDLVAVKRCLLAEPAVNVGLPLAQAWIGSLSTKVKRVEIAGADALVFAAQAEGVFAAADDAASNRFLREHTEVAGLSLRGRGWNRKWGDDRVRVDVGNGETVELGAGGFVQVNTAANNLMLATVLELAALTPADRVLDLYAGFGNLTFPLARRAAGVTAVERDVAAARAGESHARANAYDGVRFLAAEAGEFLARAAREQRAFDLVVLDPPRQGAAEVVDALLEMRPGRLIYVSCNPSTLARDLRRLAARYTLSRVQPLDFFPQTYHVEAVAALRLTDQ